MNPFRSIVRLFQRSSAFMIRTAHPNGHFYSPVVDPAELSERLEQIYPGAPKTYGIDFNDPSHLDLIERGLTFPLVIYQETANVTLPVLAKVLQGIFAHAQNNDLAIEPLD